MMEKKTKKEYGKFPNVLIAGFPRCGTTYLYNLLKQHQEVSVSKEKELQWFNLYPFGFYPNLKTFNKRFLRTQKRYLNLCDFSNKEVRIDFSVMTAYDKKSANRIYKKLGDIKIIFLTRNKKTQMRSIEKMIKINGFNNKEVDKEWINKRGIAPFKKQFSKVLILSLVEGDLIKNLKKIFNFLEISDSNLSNFDFNVDKHKSFTHKLLRKTIVRRKIYFFMIKPINLFLFIIPATITRSVQNMKFGIIKWRFGIK